MYLQDNLFEWHFSVRGPPDSDFDGGVYHGRIVLPPEYPMKPPSIILLTVSTQNTHTYTHTHTYEDIPLSRSITANDVLVEVTMKGS